jgi:hypothetical protein
MKSTPELEAEIARLHYAEHWPVGTIAAQLETHVDQVRRVLGLDAPRAPAPPRPRIVDPYRPFIDDTLRRYPKLRATRLYDMVRERGFPGSVRTVREHVALPVTRGELREELEQLQRRFQEFQQELRIELKAELAPLATKAELAPLATKAELEPLATKARARDLGGALLTRIESSERRLIERIDGTEQRLNAELARHAGALHESMSARFVAGDEKYADLPGRVNRLEAAVFAPRPR